MKYQDSKEIAEVYNKFGRYYHDSRKNDSGRLYNEYIDIPATLSLLPDNVKNLKVLDAGCGSGIYANMVAKRGAKVVGIDVSEEMIKIASEETPKELGVEYTVGDLYKLPFQDGSFNLIICTYVLENIESLDKVFDEFNRVLTPQGRCILSISHPLRAQSTKSKKEDKEIWVIEDYYEAGMRKSDFGSGMIVPKYKRTLEEYVKAIKKSGFVVTDLLEPRPVKEGKDVDPVNYEKAMRLPQLLVMELKKIET